MEECSGEITLRSGVITCSGVSCTTGALGRFIIGAERRHLKDRGLNAVSGAEGGDHDGATRPVMMQEASHI